MNYILAVIETQDESVEIYFCGRIERDGRSRAKFHNIIKRKVQKFERETALS